MNKKEIVWQFGKYAAIGVMGVIFDLTIFYLLTRVLGINFLIANLISVLTVTIHNFIWHKYLTFKSAHSKKTRTEFKKFALVSGSAFLVQQFGLPLLVLLPLERVVGQGEDLVAKLLIVAFVGTASFYFNRTWTFKKN